MTVRRMAGIPGFSIDRVAAAAGNDPQVLRLENLDTDIAPPAAAISRTRDALSLDEANSYLPFTGSLELRAAVAAHIYRQTGHRYNLDEVLITCGGTEGMLDALTRPDRRDPDARLGRTQRRSVCATGLQQRTRGTTCGASRPDGAGASLRVLDKTERSGCQETGRDRMKAFEI